MLLSHEKSSIQKKSCHRRLSRERRTKTKKRSPATPYEKELCFSLYFFLGVVSGSTTHIQSLFSYSFQQQHQQPQQKNSHPPSLFVFLPLSIYNIISYQHTVFNQSNNLIMVEQKHKVAVIGAGVAGCAMAGALQDYGVEFVVFDKNPGPGGLWANNYPGAAGTYVRVYVCFDTQHQRHNHTWHRFLLLFCYCYVLCEFMNSSDQYHNQQHQSHTLKCSMFLSSSCCHYILIRPNQSVQATTELYEYPCKKYPDSIRNRSTPPAPTAAEVCTYLKEYIEEKKMGNKFFFNKTVTNVSCQSENNWVISFDDSTKQNFTFVVICTGLVSVKPKIIHIPGSEAFIKDGGIIIHSSERTSDDIMVGKNVIVIGNGKSAVDAAMAASEIAKKQAGNSKGDSTTTNPPIQLARRQIWYVPRYILGFLQYKWAFHTRLGSLLQPPYYETPFLFRIIHTIFAPIKWVLWRVVEGLLLCQYRIPYKVWPTPFTIESAALETSILITDENHLQKLRSGDIDMKIGTIRRLKPGRKAVLNDGTEVDVDIIIQATGWSPGYVTLMDTNTLVENQLGSTAKDGLDVCDDGLWLYRNILPSGFNGMAFVGANTLTFINCYTSYIQAYWLAPLLANIRPWPDQDHMAATVEREKAFKRKSYPNGDMRGASIELYMQDYHDVLFKEMMARKPFPWYIRPIADLVIPVLPSVMKGCLEPINMVMMEEETNKKPTTVATNGENGQKKSG